jgi:hypothetical protein
MVTTEAPAVKPKVRRSADGKYGFWSSKSGHISWMHENEMDERDRAEAQLPPLIDAGTYADDIQFATEMAQDCDDRAKHASGNDRYRLLNEAIQWRTAAENYRDAELVEAGADIMFGYAPHYRGYFPMAPQVPGYTPEPVVIPYHTIRLNDPVRIAWLRRHLRNRSNPNLIELSADEELVGMYGKEGIYRLDAVISMETGQLTGWLPREAVEKMKDAKMAKP